MFIAQEERNVTAKSSSAFDRLDAHSTRTIRNQDNEVRLLFDFFSADMKVFQVSQLVEAALALAILRFLLGL